MSLNNDQLEIVIKALDQASGTLRKIQGEVGRTAKTTSRMGTLMRNNFEGAAAAGTGLVVALGAVTAQGFSFNSAVEQSSAKINAFTKDAGKTAAILDFVKQEAAKTQFSFEDMADAAAGLVPASKSSGVALETLIRQAEVLAALNPAEGLKGAAFSLREALSGDFVSIVERFNLPRQRLNELKAEGVPAIEAIRRSLAEMGIDFDVVAKQGETTSAKWAQITDKFKMSLGALTAPLFARVGEALEKLSPIMDQLQPRMEALGKWISENRPALYAIAGAIGGILVGALVALVIAFWEVIAVVAIVAASMAAFGALAGFIQDKWADISGFFSNIWKSITGFATDTYNALMAGINAVVAAYDTAISAIVGAWNAYVSVVSGAWNAVIGFIAERLDYFVNHFWESIGFLIGFILSLPAKVIIAFIGLTTMALQLLGKWLGDMAFAISKWGADVVKYLTSINWGEVFMGMLRAYVGVVQSIWGAAINTFNNVVRFVVGIDWRGVFMGLLNAWLGIGQGIMNAAVNVFNFLKNIRWADIFVGIGKGIGNAIIGLIEGALNGAMSGIPGAPKMKIPRFAGGTNFAPGGLALVGEQGPELVSLPRGSGVTPSGQTAEMLGGKVELHAHLHVENFLGQPGELDAFAEKVYAALMRKAHTQGVQMPNLGIRL